MLLTLHLRREKSLHDSRAFILLMPKNIPIFFSLTNIFWTVLFRAGLLSDSCLNLQIRLTSKSISLKYFSWFYCCSLKNGTMMINDQNPPILDCWAEKWKHPNNFLACSKHSLLLMHCLNSGLHTNVQTLSCAQKSMLSDNCECNCILIQCIVLLQYSGESDHKYAQAKHMPVRQ